MCPFSLLKKRRKKKKERSTQEVILMEVFIRTTRLGEAKRQFSPVYYTISICLGTSLKTRRQAQKGASPYGFTAPAIYETKCF